MPEITGICVVTGLLLFIIIIIIVISVKTTVMSAQQFMMDGVMDTMCFAPAVGYS